MRKACAIDTETRFQIRLYNNLCESLKMGFLKLLNKRSEMLLCLSSIFSIPFNTIYKKQ